MDVDVEEVIGVAQGSARRRTIVRALLWGSAISIGLVLGYFAIDGYETGSRARYVTEVVTHGDLTVTVTATGTVEPTDTVEVSGELSGIIREVLVDHNDPVEAGQHLAKLDTDKLDAQVRRSRATLRAANAKVAETKATVVEKKRDLERQERLAARNFSSQHNLDAAKAAYDRSVASVASAEADVSVAQADLEYNETNLRKACICSPINGVVLRRNVDPGQTVATSFQAPTLFVVARDLKEMDLEVDVDEADVAKVKEGQKAVFTVDAHADVKFPADIRQLRFGPETVEGVVTYKAVLSVDNSQLLLRPGMTATAEITVQHIKNVLLVPNAALRFSPSAEKTDDGGGFLKSLMPGPPKFREPSKQALSGSDRTVWVLREGEPTAVRVAIGATDGTTTEILKGDIAAGHKVIVDGGTATR